MAISDLTVVIFASQSVGQEPTIVAGLTEGLQVRSGHRNLSQFHLWFIHWTSSILHQLIS